MKNIIDLNSQLFQTSVKPISKDKLRVIIKQNSFIAGDIILSEKTFYNVPRFSHNLFHLFGSPGLGLNSELLNIILPHFNINRIIVPYQGLEFETTADKWRRLGIVSPYCSQTVDKQIILSMDLINMNNAEKYRQTIKPPTQLNLFGTA